MVGAYHGNPYRPMLTGVMDRWITRGRLTDG